MNFKQYKKDGSCDIYWTWKERFTILFTGKLHLSSLFLKHFGNTLVGVVAEWNSNFNPELAKKVTSPGKDIDYEKNQ